MKTKLVLFLIASISVSAFSQVTVIDHRVVTAPVATNDVVMTVYPVKYDLFYAYRSGTNRNALLIWRHVTGTNLDEVVNNLGNGTVTFHH